MQAAAWIPGVSCGIQVLKNLSLGWWLPADDTHQHQGWITMVSQACSLFPFVKRCQELLSPWGDAAGMVVLLLSETVQTLLVPYAPSSSHYITYVRLAVIVVLCLLRGSVLLLIWGRSWTWTPKRYTGCRRDWIATNHPVYRAPAFLKCQSVFIMYENRFLPLNSVAKCRYLATSKCRYQQ